VEFTLVIPLFLTTLIAVLEFALLLNALLATNYASRDAALVAAEAGNSTSSDCSILRQVEAAYQTPADPGQIQAVTIAWTDANGVTKTNGGVPYSNVWTRTGSTTCTLSDGTVVTVPYVRATNDYPEASRCTILVGCGAPHTPSVDTIAVQVTYRYQFHTPLGNLLGPLGSSGGGWTFQQSNAMRMEPVL
jgi:Flp pilus assembly protein TadG